MAEYTTELATDITFPHILVYRRYRDGEHSGYKVLTEEEYVMYDTTEPAEEPIYDRHGNIIGYRPCQYYYTRLECPVNFDFDNFTYVAVPRDSVDNNYIFGRVEPPTEIM